MYFLPIRQISYWHWYRKISNDTQPYCNGQHLSNKSDMEKSRSYSLKTIAKLLTRKKATFPEETF